MYNGTIISEENFRRWANEFGRVNSMFNPEICGYDYNQPYTITINNVLQMANQSIGN